MIFRNKLASILLTLPFLTQSLSYSVAFLISSMRSRKCPGITRIYSPRVTITTQCWARRRKPHKSSSKNRNKIRHLQKRASSNLNGKLTEKLFAYELHLIEQRGFDYVLGSDESGRGAIAGPVVTATCTILTYDENLEQVLRSIYFNNIEHDDVNIEIPIKDSKQLLPDERERIYQTILDHPECFAFSVAARNNIEIDTTNNILTSTMECFQESIQELAQKCITFSFEDCYETIEQNMDNNDHSSLSPSPSLYSIVDGKQVPKLTMEPSFPCRPMVKADSQVYTVALASIIAKVTRDRTVQEWHEQYPQYGFDVHKGYATKQHIEAIHRYGSCPLHRMTFKSLKGR